MLKSDLERLFRVEFFTIVFAIIVGVILLPFVPAILGLAVGAIVIVTVIGIGEALVGDDSVEVTEIVGAVPS